MADLTITAASVLKGSSAQTEHGTSGATVTAGQPVYLDTAAGRYELSDANSATPAARGVRGIALNGAADGQPLTIARSGPVTIGATLTPGAAYYLSATAGGICPYADLTTGDEVVQIGLASSASVLEIDIQDTGVVL